MSASAPEPAAVLPLWSADRFPKATAASEQSFLGGPGAAEGTVMIRNVTEASLSVFPAENAAATGAGVILCPGGGWRLLAWTHEGLQLAQWLNARGCTVFLLKYRLMPTNPDPQAYAQASATQAAAMAQRVTTMTPPTALAQLTTDASTVEGRRIACEDGLRALELAREIGPQWGVDPKRIGIAGFSAGAFLSLDVALTAREAPAFVAPIYGGDLAPGAPPAQAPPLFSAVTEDDRIFIEMCRGVDRAWRDAGGSSQLHVYATGGHGFGMTRQGLASDAWLGPFETWLRGLGVTA